MNSNIYASKTSEDNENELVESHNDLTLTEKAAAFIQANRESIIRGGFLILGVAIGFGVATYLTQENIEEDDVLTMEDIEALQDQ